MKPMYKKKSSNCTAFSLFYMFDLDRCGRCLQEEPPTEEEQDLVPWVFCLLCEQWFHCSCEQCDQHRGEVRVSSVPKIKGSHHIFGRAMIFFLYYFHSCIYVFMQYVSIYLFIFNIYFLIY